MLKITTQEEEKGKRLKLEGRLAGPWVQELDRVWSYLIPFLSTEKLSVDLRGVTYVDQAGRDLLAEMYQSHGVRFLADTPLTKYFAEEAMHNRKEHEHAGSLRVRVG